MTNWLLGINTNANVKLSIYTYADYVADVPGYNWDIRFKSAKFCIVALKEENYESVWLAILDEKYAFVTGTEYDFSEYTQILPIQEAYAYFLKYALEK